MPKAMKITFAYVVGGSKRASVFIVLLYTDQKPKLWIQHKNLQRTFFQYVLVCVFCKRQQEQKN